MNPVVVDDRLRFLWPLIQKTVARFGLKWMAEVRALTPEECERESEWGHVKPLDSGGVELGLALPGYDPLPFVTLAHELAHLGRRGEWPHGPRHDRLTARILRFWQQSAVDEIREVCAAWRDR